MVNEQKADKSLQDIWSALAVGPGPTDPKTIEQWKIEGLSDDQINKKENGIKAMCTYYIIADGVLMVLLGQKKANASSIASAISAKIVVPESLRYDITMSHHQPAQCGHQGAKRTLERIAQYFWWPCMRKQITKIVQGCLSCQLFKQTVDNKVGKMQPIVATHLLDILGIDIVGPFPATLNGNQYILTMLDHATRWAIGAPIKNAKAATVVDAFITHCVEKLGLPKTLLSDQGVQFTSVIMKRALQRLGVAHSTTAPYKPSTNGKTERMHRVLNNHLFQRIP